MITLYTTLWRFVLYSSETSDHLCCGFGNTGSLQPISSWISFNNNLVIWYGFHQSSVYTKPNFHWDLCLWMCFIPIIDVSSYPHGCLIFSTGYIHVLEPLTFYKTMSGFGGQDWSYNWVGSHPWFHRSRKVSKSFYITNIWNGGMCRVKFLESQGLV